MDKNVIMELIQRRRLQVWIHSVLYYRLNQTLIDDATWDRWARELADLQAKHPEIARECRYHDVFKDFDGSSGFDLPMYDSYVLAKATQLLNYHAKSESEGAEQQSLF